MIIDLPRFVDEEKPNWQELEKALDRIEREPEWRMSLAELSKFHYLYQRTSAGLARLETFANEPGLRAYLESLVARAYSEIHETREPAGKWRPWRWFTEAFPRAFRRRVAAFWLAAGLTVLGSCFGAVALGIDSEAKDVIMPFDGLRGTPTERVKKEESGSRDRLAGHKSTFAAQLMTHNTQVSIFTMALAITWGIGTSIMLFYNGVILGAVAFDYVRDGQTQFLLGWLLPHGAVEIPSILIAGQAGFVLASALIGWGSRISRRARLREVGPDLMALMLGVAVMLVWAGLVESFLSQYHQPVIPYGLKIAFGLIEMGALGLFLARAGR